MWRRMCVLCLCVCMHCVVCACMCVVCACVSICVCVVCVHTCTHPCMLWWKSEDDVVLLYYCPDFPEIRTLTEPNFTVSGRLAVQQVPGFCPAPLLSTGVIHVVSY